MNESIIQAAIESADPMTAELAFKEIDAAQSSLTNPCDKAALLLRKAKVYGILHRFDEARIEIAHALKTAPPADPDIAFQCEHLDALLYHEEQKLDKAFAGMTAILLKYNEQLKLPELKPIYEDIQQRRGFELVHLRQFAEALPIFDECLTFEMTRGDRAEILSNLGVCHSHLKQYDQARDHFLEAFEVGLMKQSQPEAHLQLGIVYFHLNLLVEAKREIQLCAQHSAPHHIPMKLVYEWLSTVCRRLGEKDQAEEYARLANPS
jgi:tetratricopeptide (TPR) repeat protein